MSAKTQKNGRETTIEAVSLCRIAVWRKSRCLIVCAVLDAYRTGRNNKCGNAFTLLDFNQSVILINCASQLMGVGMLDLDRLIFARLFLNRVGNIISIDIRVR